ncbi:DNA-binding protein SMUBP-2 [Ascosphaera apis ARSEF 7405]|uniref:DNA-binding protein SMUBP-2 n=1 Tax=Ascosphaera apis ARSEF 7405 TaxID=392613 RepID=A0A162ICY0_9EURO|nr:DNA-binding protein SMUBP-2 [Ascosphaera apis ARSEF 7405]
MLTTQYRMNEVIMKFPSQELYDNELVAADSVKDRVLTDLSYSTLNSDMGKLSLDDGPTTGKVEETEETKYPLIFYDTQGGDFPEDEDKALSDAESKLKPLLGSDSKSNTYEAMIARSHILSLIEAGVKASDIAVITPYNAQVAALAAILRDDERTADVEIGSVDGFQGREKEAVLVTLVRSNEKGEVGFLGEKRRLNVAMTRPKRQLCVIGDSDTIQKGSPFLKRWMEFLEANADLRYPDVGEHMPS